MALSEQTLDHLLEAEGNIRSALKCAAVNEKPLVITQISKLLYDIESMKEFEKLQDIVDTAMKEREEWLHNSKDIIKFIDKSYNYVIISTHSTIELWLT